MTLTRASPTQVWCCLLMDDGGEITTIQRFADPQTLSITVDGRPVTEKPKFGTPARFKWHTEEALNSTLVVVSFYTTPLWLSSSCVPLMRRYKQSLTNFTFFEFLCVSPVPSLT